MIIFESYKKYFLFAFLSKSFSKLKTEEFKCPKDGYVIIKNSELLTGIIDGTAIGKESKNGLIFALMKDCGNREAAKFLTRISKFSSRWICDYGFSLGLGDVTPKRDLVEKKLNIISEGFKKCDDMIKLYNDGQIKLKPGMNMEKSLENDLIGILSEIRNQVGICLNQTLPKKNSALIMTVCGSKGKEMNLAQMISCVGQQEINGERVPDGFNNRSLPHFEEYSKYPSSKGFIGNSFFDGMNATDFFFHTMGGRVGLVDSAVKTAQTGYMQRRLMKIMEDLTVQYNNTVTMSSGEIIEFLYGDDGIKPIHVDTDNSIVYLPRLWDLICSNHNIKNDIRLNAEQIMEQVENNIQNCPIDKHEISEMFINSIRSFFGDKIKLIKDSIKSFGSNGKGNNIVNNICSIGKNQMKYFFEEIWDRYKKAKVNPGEAVGAVAAMSVGEPCTQMTLKTFHFAGIASMDITLGVPRITEIINYTRNISTPIINVKLIQEDSLIAAKIVKGRIEKVKLRQICKYIKEIISPDGCYIKVKLDPVKIDEKQLKISIGKIREALLLNKKKLKLKENHIIIENEYKLRR